MNEKCDHEWMSIGFPLNGVPYIKCLKCGVFKKSNGKESIKTESGNTQRPAVNEVSNSIGDEH